MLNDKILLEITLNRDSFKDKINGIVCVKRYWNRQGYVDGIHVAPSVKKQGGSFPFHRSIFTPGNRLYLKSVGKAAYFLDSDRIEGGVLLPMFNRLNR